ncbi:Alb1 domain-containing protein [Trichoderma evansii]
MAKTQKAAPSRRSRAARRATSPSIDTDKSLKNATLPASSSSTAAPRPSVLAARHNAGVTKKTRRGRAVSAKGRRRQEKGLEMAEAVIERTSKKLEKSFSRARVVQSRAKKWDDINKDAQKSKENAFAVLMQDGDEEDKEEREWETDEEMDGENAKKDTAAPTAFAPPTLAAPVLGDDDDEIL